MTEQRPPVDPDELDTWTDDDLVRALRAPGTATELADEEQYVAAFRDASGSNVVSLPRRVVGRLGAGGTAVVVTVTLTTGVAAAYTGHLPNPVQTFAHHVIGAPAPHSPGHQRPEAATPRPTTPSGSQSPSTPSTTDPSGGPSAGPTTGPPSPTGVPGLPVPVPGGHHGRHSSLGPSGSPVDEPSQGVSSSPTPSTGSAAAATTMSAAAHRVGLGQTMLLTSLVTDAGGAALPGEPVVLQERDSRHWRPVAQTTTDDTGIATASTPPLLGSARFRWHAAPGVNSLPWLVRMVPALTVTADVGGATTTVTPAAQGSDPGDRVELFRHVAGRATLVRRARLDATGSVPIPVVTPRRRAVYVVRLLGTRRHAAVRARVVVVPPRPAAVTIVGSAARVANGGSAVIGGTVTSATGAILPGHKVVLLERGPVHWRPVGHAVSDADGHVSIATPAITATARFRLHTDHRAHSVTWRIVELPALSVSGQRSGGTVVITATTSGARPGDKVVLLRSVNGRLATLRHGRLDANGAAVFSVTARRVRTEYVVRLVATKRHGPASSSVIVPKP
jgi:hypothetical protein